MTAARWLAVLFLCLVCAVASAAPMRFASWNIEHLGWTDEERNYVALAQTISYFDFVAIQEVMDAAAVETLRQHLNRATGERWASLVSHSVGRSDSYQEAYAFLWRADRIALMGSATVYTDDRDFFAREPFSAIFVDRKDQTLFLVATVHILYGDGVADRLPEILALDNYWEWLKTTFGSLPIILSGDFNLAPDHSAYDVFTVDAVPLITEGATTLGTQSGYANLYDNIWVDRAYLARMPRAGIFKFPTILGIPHQIARDTVSDHAPVFAILDFQRSN